MRRLLTIAAFAAALSSAAAATPQAAAPTDDPRAYLDRALSELETKHINRAKADWPKLRAEARKLAADAQTPADTYKAIDHVIEALGEKHTRLYAAPKKQPQPAASSAPAPAPKPYKMPEPTGELIDGRYGYIAIPQFGAGADHPDSDLFTAMSRRLLLAHDRAGVCGWIVDLRGNSGGNIWPMVDGLVPLLAPLIGSGPAWSFEVNGKVSPIMLSGGRFRGEGAPDRPSFESRLVKNARAPLAVLIDEDTASSAEGIAGLFKGLPNVRHFGQTTADYVTVNNPVTLSDGARIQMTVGYTRNRDGSLQTGPIQPDEPTSSEAAREAALRWLSSQKCEKDAGA